jgi:DnaJ family protein C protein 22
VGNIGKERGSIWWPLLGCYLTAPFHVLGYSSYIWTTLCGMIGWQLKSKQWKRFVRDPNPNWKRILIVLMAFGLYLGLWSSYVYFNLKIVTKDGDKIKFRDAAENFLKSPAVHQFKDNLGHLWKHMWEHGFWSTMSQLIESLDPLGEKHALRVLELKRGVSQEEIKARYRDLSKKWHPDKFPNEVEKEDAHAK